MTDDLDTGATPGKSDEQLAAEWAQAMEDDAAPQAASDAVEDAAPEPPAAAAQETPDAAPLPELGASAASAASAQNLDVVLDIPVRLSMEVGNTEVSIGDLLRLNRGSVVELDRLAGEPLDVLVNGTLVAHGEVVVVNDRFGVRLIDVLSPQDRIRTLA